MLIWFGSHVVVYGACPELECGCLHLGCDCVGLEHETIGEGRVPYGSDLLPEFVVYGCGVG